MNRRGIWMGLVMLLWGMQVTAQRKPFVVMAYYSGDASEINQYPVEKCTHIIYSFLHLQGNRLDFSGDRQKEIVKSLVQLKGKYRGLKILLSLGGWGGCAPCSEVFSTDAGRREFAGSVRSILNEYGADGIDLDWEYPAIEGYPGHRYSAEDRPNFTALLKTLRDSLGPEKELSFAAGGFTKFLEEAVDWAEVVKYVDHVNLMTYDLVNGNSTVTGHHTPLYSTPEQVESTDHCVSYLLAKGIDPAKLVIGAAFYGRSFVQVKDDKNGLYQPGQFKSFIPYRTMENRISEEKGYRFYFDEVAMAPSWYNPKLEELVTFENKQSVALKTRYAIDKGLGGIMFWELTLDKPSGGLLDAIDEARRQGQ